MLAKIKSFFKDDVQDAKEDVILLFVAMIFLIGGVTAGIIYTTADNKHDCDKYSTLDFYGKPYVCLELVK